MLHFEWFCILCGPQLVVKVKNHLQRIKCQIVTTSMCLAKIVAYGMHHYRGSIGWITCAAVYNLVIIQGSHCKFIIDMVFNLVFLLWLQQESIERREELLRELEVADQMTRRESKEAEAKKKSQAKELQSQVCSMCTHFVDPTHHKNLRHTQMQLTGHSIHHYCQFQAL